MTAPVTWTTTLTPATALERLRTRVSRPRAASSVTGDYKTDMGVVGVFRSDRFDLRLQRFIANPAALHAFGSVRADPSGSLIEVRFARMTWATWVRRLGMLFFALLIAVQLYAALIRPIFWVGVGFLAVMAALTMWSSRIRPEDRAVLGDFIAQTFADVRATSPRAN
jgi:hypothetical protein